MLKLFKYLKPYTIFILLSIGLLFVQAMSDLSLPDYMSDIVNVGIQQGGIDSSVPEVIRESTMKKIKSIMTKSENDLISKNYTKITKGSTEYDYPALKDENLYILKDNSMLNNNELINIFSKGFVAVYGIEQAKSQAKDGYYEMNGTKIPENVDLFLMMQIMPDTQKEKITESIQQQMDLMGESITKQSSINFLREEYTSIGVNIEKKQTGYIMKTGIIMLIISLISAFSTVMVGLFASRTAAGFSRDLRSRVFTRVENFSNIEFDKFSTASLITRTTNDITQIQMLIVIMIRMVFYAPIMGVGGIIRALDKSTSMSWIIALAVIVLLGLISVIFSIALPRFKKIQKLVDKLNLVTREHLSGLMVIRAFNAQNFEEKRFDEANKDVTKINLFVSRLMVIMIPMMMLIMNAVTLLIVWVGAHQIQNSAMQVGDMMAFMQYAMQIIFSFLMLSMMFIMLPRASVSGTRVAEVLETKPVIIDPENPENFGDNFNPVVEFKNVSFRYNGAEENMLKNINFEALPGKTTAIIGSTGSGKTTLLNLIPRFYDVTEGTVTIDGKDIRNIKQKDLREKIGYIPQKNVLFSGTIESNIKYGKENASESEVREAAEISQSMEFIDEKEDKFNSSISQGGSNVSGGQKQRLTISRAIIKKPSVYLFDDSFSALDFKTDSKLRKQLKSITKNSTVIIVAQRISTIINAEQIIVLDEGKIVGKGTHKELMKTCPVYQEIAMSQLSKEELA
ncbi:MAG: ABC transporter ATP-binding protein [Thermotogae bacterium]|nr:ABC transporter ATP-binding protein [Thermotogota bacterium]MCP5465140.1 ABC transporter ATP-binding protein [Thermotogota bacterium]HOO74725.1 ABC transporter ATP-binding protein [Tepiditoga sp.]